MKYASAMKYGGELVDAVDCDYESFKELVPLCSNCKEPVFLRIGGQRESVKGKAYQIGPHWCHYKGVSKEQVAGCELRVNGYTEKDRAKIASQARGQRLKLLQRWFGRILESNPFLDHCFVCEKQVIESWGVNQWNAFVSMGAQCLAHPGSVEFVKSIDMAEIKQHYLNSGSENAQTQLYADLLESKEEDVPDFFRSGFKPSTIKYICRVFSSEMEFAQNKQILIEVIGFLKSPKGWPILSAIMADSVAMIKPESDVNEYVYMAVRTSVWQLVSIPWASEFQRLEAEAKQRRDAA